MCAQVVCEVPQDCTFNPNDPQCCNVAQISCAPMCPTDCNPCGAPQDFNPCPPDPTCNMRCECGDFSGCCYQQPPRVKPIRPLVCLGLSNAPLETDTVYKRSYYGNFGSGFRPKPALPCNHLAAPQAPMEKCTVQKLSYMPHCNAQPAQPIKPKENGLRFNGPIYAMTSQKHDFVPKGYGKRAPIRPCDGIYKPTAPLESCTVNKLSYLPNDVCRNPPPKPIVQTYNYIRPTGPSEKCTIQKLSYLPVCLQPKDPMPWAEQVRCVPPAYENLCTTYNLSYMPNCKIGRTAPINPIQGLRFFGTDSGDGNTVYKLSYMPVDCRSCRPAPIKPAGGLQLPTGPMEQCTIQKLSYQPNCCAERTKPIRPKENCIKPMGAVYHMTTQKHDFVPKTQCRRAPIVPPTSICRASGGMEKCTVNRLSYMPVNVCEYRRPNPIMPRPGVCRPEGPIENCTTYKLSYLPNCVKAREPLPWAGYTAYVRPTAPIEKCTIQRLSYGPPGTFNKCSAGCTQNSAACPFPTAGIC